jgi:hypothetical protein
MAVTMVMVATYQPTVTLFLSIYEGKGHKGFVKAEATELSAPTLHLLLSRCGGEVVPCGHENFQRPIPSLRTDLGLDIRVFYEHCRLTHLPFLVAQRPVPSAHLYNPVTSPCGSPPQRQNQRV